MSRAALLVGYGSDNTIRYTISRFRQQGVRFGVLDIADYLQSGRTEFASYDPFACRIVLPGATFDLSAFAGVYIRSLNISHHRQLPPDLQRLVERKLSLLGFVFDLLPAQVINRPGRGVSNSSKPYQLVRLRACGLKVPTSYSTNMPDLPHLIELIAAGKVVYKSNSAFRSIVHRTGPSDLDRLATLGNCPVLFQDYIAGPDVRVHALGERLFGLQIEADTIDYRYPLDPSSSRFREVAVPPDVAQACRAFMEDDGLSFVGFDFKIDPDTGQWYCLEANPMPGYDGFDRHLGGQISDALVEELFRQA